MGAGRLIFGFPPGQVAVHFSQANDAHEFHFMCFDVTALIEKMKKHQIACAPVQDQGYGLLTQLIAIAGGAAENGSAITVARKKEEGFGRGDRARNSIQIALFVDLPSLDAESRLFAADPSALAAR